MKNLKTQFWLLIGLGTVGLISSFVSFFKGENFEAYYFGGFCGLILIGMALFNNKRK